MYFQQILQTTYIVAMLSRRIGNIQASLKYLKMNQALATDLEQATEVEYLFLMYAIECRESFDSWLILFSIWHCFERCLRKSKLSPNVLQCPFNLFQVISFQILILDNYFA